MYRFQIRATTDPGEAIALVGASPQLGSWDVLRCVRLQTRRDQYPLWWADIDLRDEGWGERGDRAPADPAILPKIEYKYVRILADGSVEWEAWGTNRWVPLEAEPLPSPILVEDGAFGSIPTYPYGYFAEPTTQPPAPPRANGLKIVVIGSSVALGCSAWLLRGWAWQLGQALHQQYGHQLINVSELGTNVATTIARFARVVSPAQPDIVIIALSLGNEGFAASSPRQRPAIQRRFENGLQHLIKMTREIGAFPILGGVYPNGDYAPEHYTLLQETHQRMLTWGVPVLDWLSVLGDGQGRWQAGISLDIAHPNTLGHRLMYEAIDRSLFDLTPADLTPPPAQPTEDLTLYQDEWGFRVVRCQAANRLRVINATPHAYTLSPDWQALQTALQAAPAPAGLYMAEATDAGLLSLFVETDGTVTTTLAIPAQADLYFDPAVHFWGLHHAHMLFHDGHLSILKISDHSLYIINESDHEYNIQPMWQDMRAALKAMPSGVYEDPCQPDAAFRTLMIGPDGLESRVKAPAQAAMMLTYRCSLAEVSRIAIIPLGDRCAVRMLLYKLEYDGPAFPFDLTRTTNLADVADMIQSDFHDMWNPHFLHYHHDARRIYHTKWTGLSFAHEVEESDDPLQDLTPVYERMRTRYTARSRRFWYTLQRCDKALFVRTGLGDRNSVIDLVHKLELKCQGKPFRLLIISPQPSDEFANLPNVLHYDLEFNPDRMYEDLGHWLACTEVMRTILNSLGVSSKNLFWCPPHIPQ